MKRIIQLILLLALVAGGVLLWRHLFPGPEGLIRKQMSELRELVSFSGAEGNLAVLGDARRMGELFTEDAQIRVDVQGGPHVNLTGRDEIVQATVGARQLVGGLKVEFLDVTVTLGSDGRSAVVEATGKAVPSGSKELWIQELRFRFIETKEGWLISSVETVRTLTRFEIRNSRIGFTPIEA
jgi:hypothetical protein